MIIDTDEIQSDTLNLAKIRALVHSANLSDVEKVENIRDVVESV